MRDMGHCCEAAHSQGRVVPSSANASPGRGLTAPPVSMPDTCSNATSSWVFALGVPPSSPAHEHSRASSACSGMRLRARRAALLACPRAQQGVKRLFWHASSRSACRPPRLPTSAQQGVKRLFWHASSRSACRPPRLRTSTAGRQAPVLACVFALGVPPSSPAHEHSRASSACSGMRLRARRAALLACARHSRVSCACSGMRLRAQRAALLACPRAQQGVKRLFWHASSRSACRPPRLPTSTAGRQAPVLACVFALSVPPSSPAHEHSRASSACSGMRLRARRAALLACARHSRVSCACSGMRLRAQACRLPRLPTSTAGRQAPVLACVFALGVPPSSPAHEHSRASSACSGARLRAGRAALLACPRHSRASGACSGNHAEPLRWGWRPL